MNSVLIIAEAGVNHNGDLNTALQLIDEAAKAGADYVKFQTFKADKLVNRFARKADYQIKNMHGESDTQFEMLKKLEISEAWYPILIERCSAKNVRFLSTGFDEDSIDFLETLHTPLYKIPSGEITNKPYLQHVARKCKEIILSSGMSNLMEIESALKVMEAAGASREIITVLHCNTEYPTPMEDVNLTAMQQIAKELKVQVGYSDHTTGIEVPIAAVALGARVIEKHFTLSRNMVGPDHAASLEPHELCDMVSAIRNVEKAISGNGIKEASASEKKNIAIARKSIHLKRDLLENETISEEDLIMLRPGDGISPMEIGKIVGKKMRTAQSIGHKLLFKDLQ
jgi:N-acetylneuraminate synthase/N,N'-diacetyllegionaminate synthase